MDAVQFQKTNSGAVPELGRSYSKAYTVSAVSIWAVSALLSGSGIR